MQLNRGRFGVALAACVIGVLSVRMVAHGASVGPEVQQELVAGRTPVVIVQLRDETSSVWSAKRASHLDAVRARVLSRLGTSDFRRLDRWQSIPGFAGVITREGLRKLAASPEVLRIDLDAAGGGHLAESGALVRAPSVHALGYTGAGVVVAVLDSGVDASHVDLADALIAERCFCQNADGTGCCPDGSTNQGGEGSARDDHGHGSNVAGIIVSNGTLAPRGIAPDSSLVAVRVLDSENRFNSTSQILSALDWIITSRPDVDVVNMSLGTGQRFQGNCDSATAWTALLASAIDTLRARGTPCFVSAGNEADLAAMGAPACVASSIAVGAVYDADIGTVTFDSCEDATSAPDRVACFSNAGTALDLLAPGAAITSTSLTTRTSTFFGTSQASPHAAGGAALLLSKNASLTVDEIEDALVSTGTPVTDHRTGGVHPRLNLLDAIQSFAGGAGCANTRTTLCIGNRFLVSTDFSTAQDGGRAGQGNASSTAPIGYSRGGLFWFFDPENPEMLVKALDGCSINGHYWFFASAGTNVGYTITVTDTRAGATRTYLNPDLNPAQPVQDTTAFATCP